jgi:hypothetical protein
MSAAMDLLTEPGDLPAPVGPDWQRYSTCRACPALPGHPCQGTAGPHQLRNLRVAARPKSRRWMVISGLEHLGAVLLATAGTCWPCSQGEHDRAPYDKNCPCCRKGHV